MTPLRYVRRALLALALPAAPAAAQVAHDGGAPNGGAGYDVFNDFRAADDFALPGATTFDRIRAWGLLPAGVPYAPTVFWEVLADAAGLPGPSVAAGLATASMTPRASVGAGFDSWQLDLPVGPQSLGAGVYWLALHDGALGELTHSSLLWEATDGGRGSDFAVAFVPTGDWTGGWTGNLAFQLLDARTVPEPSAALLLGAGLVVLAAARSARTARRHVWPARPSWHGQGAASG